MRASSGSPTTTENPPRATRAARSASPAKATSPGSAKPGRCPNRLATVTGPLQPERRSAERTEAAHTQSPTTSTASPPAPDASIRASNAVREDSGSTPASQLSACGPPANAYDDAPPRAARRSASHTRPACAPAKGIPTTYGVPYARSRARATPSAPADTTRLTEAFPTCATPSSDKPMHHVAFTASPAPSRHSRRSSAFGPPPKSSGVSPSTFTAGRSGEAASPHGPAPSGRPSAVGLAGRANAGRPSPPPRSIPSPAGPNRSASSRCARSKPRS